MTTTSRTFHIYRYQILPTFPRDDFDLHFTPQFEIKSVDELIERKNELFAKAVKSTNEFKHTWATITHQWYEKEEYILLKIGANRVLRRITKEFKEEFLDNWPSAYLVINNNPNVQIMAIELEEQAFERTTTIVNLLAANINKKLDKYKLSMVVEPVYLESKFWDIVNTHKHRISKVTFLMVAPNLANISKNLKFDLKELKSRTNSLRTNVTLQAPPKESLKISKDDEFTQSLAEYSSKGGGTAHFRIKGLSKLIKTEDSIKTFEVDEIYFSGDSSNLVFDQLIRQLRMELKDD